MRDFTFHSPTTINFGRGQVSRLKDMRGHGSSALMVYGGGSIKRTGVYDRVMDVLVSAGIKVVELGGVEPNPRIQTVRRGVKLCREDGLDMVLAVGGGSSIDCAKVIAAGVPYDGDPWDLVLDGSKATDALPIFSVLTLAATGSEMDNVAVISDMTKNEKWGTASPCMYPTMSVLDPTYTYTVPPRQTAAGTADMMSHALEDYFTKEHGVDVQQRFAEGLLRTMAKYGPVALARPDDYEARANLMWAASWAISDFIKAGSADPWTVHPMEHELSAFYDVTHGEGLAVLTPAWMDYIAHERTDLDYPVPDLARYGRNVWDVEGSDDAAVADEAIARTRSFLFETMGMPSTLRELGIDSDEHFPKMAEKAARRTVNGYVSLDASEVEKILRRAW